MIDKAHQRKIRESFQDGHPVPVDMSTATVREITFEQAKEVILKYEWLGNMGTTVRAFGLFFGDEIAGVVCFGHSGQQRSQISVAKKMRTWCTGWHAEPAFTGRILILVPSSSTLPAN